MSNPAASNSTPDPRLVVVTPRTGQRFSPGGRVHVRISLPASLKATYVSVSAPGLGSFLGENYNGSTYDCSFTIPSYLAGPLKLQPAIIDAKGAFITGPTTTIAVCSEQAPAKIRLVNRYYPLTASQHGEQLYAKGTYHYPGTPPIAVDRDVTSAEAGTIYASNNPESVSVDSTGFCSIHREGTAAVTAENRGVRDYAVFVIEDPKHPLGVENVSQSISCTKSAFRQQRGSVGFWSDEMLAVQDLTIINKSPAPAIGPLYLVLSDLPNGVKMVNGGLSKSFANAERSYIRLQLPDGLTLQPKESIVVSLQFGSANAQDIRYKCEIFRSSRQPW
jgi:hypothetical protein